VNSNARIRILGALSLIAVWVLLLALTGSLGVLLFTAPFFMIAGILATGEHPGADLIERVARLAAVSGRPASDPTPAFGWIHSSRSRLSDLISSNLAGRAPPLSRA